MDISSIIDEIYEAAVVPDLWIRTLDRMATMSDAEGALLFTTGSDGARCISSPALASLMKDWGPSGWIERDIRCKRLLPLNGSRFLTDLDGFALEELDHEPFYTEFLRPRGLGWCAATTIRMPAGNLIFSIEKAYRKGPVGRHVVEMLDTLRPHLARATLLSIRAGLGRTQATLDILQTIGIPAAVLTHNGRAMAANDHLLACAPAIKMGAGDQVLFTSPGVQRIFAEALAGVEGKSTVKAGRSIAVPGGAEAAAQVAHVIPLRGAGRDIFCGASSLLYVTRLIQQKAPDVGLLEALFDLTRSEARVASLLVEGKSVEEIAVAQKVAQNTVRMHLKAVFTKTGARRQAQLVSLLAQNM